MEGTISLIFLQLTNSVYIIEAHGGKISVHRQTLRSEQTGGPISGVFAGGLAILLDTLFRSSDADTNAHAVVEKSAGRK
ncbi:hypothetical protein ALC56_13809 [Trachymyrmex septentrionalis]|uniref:Uncharacterized protein n=1 Tax=Trachymyrmex septentrionalis TaxID=34720 RepID=A0A195ETU5_9HYME|nr:hypothetical protein ALC56_13809 [Trachymyrmex septentrionalis]